MRSWRWCALTAVTVVVALAGCAQAGPGTGGPATSGPTTPNKAMDKVTITRSGGFAGVNQVLTVMPDGSWAYTDKRSGASQRGQLTADQMAQLGHLVSDPNMLAQRPPASSGSCADTFLYTVAVGEASVKFDDCNDKDQPAVKAVIDFLATLTPM
ncbi:MAG: hypothetical protein ACM30G_10240 [Micromonosporaceae bacterium]